MLKQLAPKEQLLLSLFEISAPTGGLACVNCRDRRRIDYLTGCTRPSMPNKSISFRMASIASASTLSGSALRDIIS